MKIIISRKGFDSAAGGVPSPIFPDEKILSLPIPDIDSKITYKEIMWANKSIGTIVEELTKGEKKTDYFAHLDPDINKNSLPRKKNWRPIFGQLGAAQKHLENQNIKIGDLFLFFGLFRNVISKNEIWGFDPNSSPKHIIWGWFQIDKILKIDELVRDKYKWAIYHPHFHKRINNSNTLYLAKDKLDIPTLKDKKINGAGTFTDFSNSRQLTANDSKLTLWKLPNWIYPTNDISKLSYHSNSERWVKKRNHTLLKSVSRGQKFVLDCNNYSKEANQWIANLFSK